MLRALGGRAGWQAVRVAGVRRRLFDVGKKVSGVLAGSREQAGDAAAATQPQRDPGLPPPDPRPPGPDLRPPGPDRSPPEASVAASDQENPVLAAPPVDVPLAVPGTLDPICAAAVELAAGAAREVGGGAVGVHLGRQPEPAGPAEAVVTHTFATLDRGYVGWHWAVTVARAPDSELVTVDEVVLLPGPDALLAPTWVPWSERLRPADLGPGDLLPPSDDDLRLVPSYADVDADALPFDLHRELGLGRPRVLSVQGRELAAERWWEGESGPFSARAKAAPGRCADCGFLVPLSGVLGRLFGVCGNETAPDDGRVVAQQHGCGAHSETVAASAYASTTSLAVEPEDLEPVELRSSATPVQVPDSAAVPEPDSAAVPEPVAGS